MRIWITGHTHNIRTGAERHYVTLSKQPWMRWGIATAYHEYFCKHYRGSRAIHVDMLCHRLRTMGASFVEQVEMTDDIEWADLGPRIRPPRWSVPLWELYSSYSRDDPKASFHAELYEQPLWAHLRGQLTDWVWNHCPSWVTNHHGGDRLLNFELACTFDIPRLHRRKVAWLQVADRNPDTWWKPGGDAPCTPQTSGS